MSTLTTPGPSPTEPTLEQVAEERPRLIAAPTRTQLAGLMLALLFLAGAVGFVVGGRDASAPGRDSVDVGFLYDMIAHHEQAVTMSNLELENGAEKGVQVFAREILASQSYEIGLMEQQLAEWGYPREDQPDTAMGWMGMPVDPENMPGMASENELRGLIRARGPDGDALFLALMQDHHRGGVHMARYAAENAGTGFVRSLAERMARNQEVEIAELDEARGRTGLSRNPPGYEAAAVPGSSAGNPLTGDGGDDG